MFAFLFLQVELFFFLSRILHKFTFLPQENGVLPDLKGVDGFTRFPAPYNIRVQKRQACATGYSLFCFENSGVEKRDVF